MIARTMRVGLVGLVAVAGLSPAPATTQDSCRVATARVERAVADSVVPLPPGWRVEMRCGRPAEVAGQADPAWRTITLWPERLVDVPLFTPWAIAHEYGHAYDHDALSASERETWRAIRGIASARHWNPAEGPLTAHEWSEQPNEDFAESFAFCWLGFTWAYRSALGQPPDRGQCLYLEAALRVTFQSGGSRAG